MNKLKDFIYDKNDVIIAALILIVAALIITWRMNVILQYPKELINSDDIQVEEPAGNQNSQSGADDTDKINGTVDGNANADGDAQTSGDSAQNDAQTQQPAQLWLDGKLAQDVEVTVDGATASAAIQCLIDKELFTDYAEYQSLCDTLGLNHEKVSAGTFTFEKGSTKEQIAKKVNWS